MELKSKVLKVNLIEQNKELKLFKSKNQDDIEPINTIDFGTGSLRLIYNGKWFLIDSIISIYVDNRLVSKESVIKGFDVIIPLSNVQNEVDLNLKIMFLSSKFKINLNPLVENIILLEYSRISGRFSKIVKVIK